MIRIKCWVVGLVFWVLCASSLSAQTPQAELFGGYSYLRINPGSGVPPIHLAGGWHASVVRNLNDWAGLAVDFSDHHKSVAGVRSSALLVTFGPRFTVRASERVQPFAHVQIGLVGPVGDGFGPFTGGLGAVFGGGVDVKVGGRVAWRAAQLDHVLTGSSGRGQHSFQFSTGIVFRLGSR